MKCTALMLLTAMYCTPPAHANGFMLASYYGHESGRVTANGERFRPSGMTAAHRSLPFGTRVRVTLGVHSVVVRINDRGPARWTGRGIDLARGAAHRLGMIKRGIAKVYVRVQGT